MSNDMKGILAQLANNQSFQTKKQYAEKCVRRWSQTPLLEGLKGDQKTQVAMILENQLRHTINENNSISTGGNTGSDSGNIQGYTAVAFPMVRKIFGNTIANNVATIQTLNAPTGLIFYLDFVYSKGVGGDVDADGNPAEANYDVATYAKGKSLYGQPVAEGVRRGASRIGGHYDLVGHGYSKWHEPAQILNESVAFAGAFDEHGDFVEGEIATRAGRNAEFLEYDPQILQLMEEGTPFHFMIIKNSSDGALFSRFDLDNAKQISLFYRVDGSTGNRFAQGAQVIPEDLVQGSKGIINVRRLNKLGVAIVDGSQNVIGFRVDPFMKPEDPEAAVLFVVHGTPDDGDATPSAVGAAAFTTSSTADDESMLALSAVLRSNFRSTAFASGATNLVPVGESDLAVDPRPLYSEITLKLGTEHMQVEKRAYRIKWTDDLATDVKAQLAIDVAEVLANTMSDAMQVDIDREILDIMLSQASAANFHWSAQVGKYINRRTGRPVTYDFSEKSAIPATANATATRQDWYHGLGQVIVGVSNEIHTRTLRGQANFIVVAPDVCDIIESMSGFQASMAIDADGQIDLGSMSIGAHEVGSIARGRFKVYRCPDFPRNKILVGYKGPHLLDAGFAYCPYVPLVITPQLANTEDFQPRQAAFTRDAKKMIRADYFGTVTVQDLDVI